MSDDPTSSAKLLRGRITDTTGSKGIYTVTTEDNKVLRNCVWGGGIIAGLIGIKTRLGLPEGCPVMVSDGDPPVIIGILPKPHGDSKTRDRQAATLAFGLTKTLEGLTSENVNTHEQVLDEGELLSDQLEGEFSLGNIFNVGIHLLTNFAKLNAGELAKVECHVLNDMVRIVSDTFRHHTAFGDYEIYNDGRLNVRWNGTSYPHEALGLEKATDKKYQASDKGVDFDSFEDLQETGRWRFSSYLGWLGNFVHLFVTDPIDGLGTMSQQALRPGKFNAHVDTDGSLLVSSVGEIALERVTRIPIPIPLKHPEDPTGAKVGDFDNLTKNFLSLWKYPKESADLFEMSFQLREYARYMSQFQSYARYHQLAEKGEYYIPSEDEAPAPDWRGNQTDVTQQNAKINHTHFDTYACYRIMRDGSIISWDGMGSCVVQAHGDIRVCATRHLTLEAAGDIRMIAGQNIYIKARRNLEIVAVVGGLILKARAYWQGLCEWGTLWLKSDAVDPKNGNIPSAENKDEDVEPILNDAAVLIEASRGRVTVDSSRTVMLQTSGEADSDDPDDISTSILLQSSQHVKLRAKTDIFLQAVAGLLGFRAARSLIFKAQKAWFDVTDKVRFGSTIDVIPGRGQIKVPQLVSKFLFNTKGIFGPEAKAGAPAHSNHIYVNKSSLTADLDDDDVLTQDDSDLLDVAVNFESLFPVKGDLTFKFQTSSEYVPDTHIFLESHAQQFIRLDLPAAYSEQYSTTKPSEEQLQKADHVSSGSAPFPGLNTYYRRHSGGENLRVASSKKGSDLNQQTALTSNPFTFSFLKRKSTYKK